MYSVVVVVTQKNKMKYIFYFCIVLLDTRNETSPRLLQGQWFTNIYIYFYLHTDFFTFLLCFAFFFLISPSTLMILSALIFTLFPLHAPLQCSMRAQSGHGCRVVEGDVAFDWAGGGVLLEQFVLWVRVWWRFCHPRQQRPAALDPAQKPLPQWLLGHSYGWGKLQDGSSSHT